MGQGIVSVDRRTLAARWIARAWAAALFLFWGAFFVEHLDEWFLRATTSPPAYVFLMQGLHALFLLALLAGWVWELPSAVVAATAGIVFFSLAGGDRAAAFVLLSVVPALLWIWTAGRASGRRLAERSNSS